MILDDGIRMPPLPQLWLIVVVTCGCFVSQLLQAEDPAAEAQTPSHTSLNFQLPSSENELTSLYEDSESRFAVVCFLGTECPLAKLYAPRLQQLSEEYSSQGVRFVGVVSNVHDSLADIRRYVQDHGLTFPILKDAGHQVADAYGAQRTSEVILVDRLFRVRYRGRIDDQYQPGVTRSSPTREDLKLAIDQCLAGEEVAVQHTDAFGCIIGREPTQRMPSEFTFAKDVSRVLQRHCVECHQQGEIGPFALTEYDEVVGWGEMLLEVIDQQRMPPWHADPQFGHYQNERSMSKADVEILRSWVHGGMPFGNADDLPPPLEANHGWQLEREPDLVLSMSHRPFQVPATGVVEYQYFVVDPGFKEDKWVTGVQVVPGNRSVVHHCIVFIRPPDGSEMTGIGWLGGYVPGQKPLPLRPGFARHVPAGSKLVFQMHYTPTGTEQSDNTRIGLIFGDDEDVTHRVFTVLGIHQDFEIPPHDDSFQVNGQVDWFPADGLLLGLTPHMHVRGKAFTVDLEQQGTRERILSVPNYDFNWQHFYVFEEPRPLGDVDRILFSAVFDNSRFNPVNPDPSQYVSWGDQTWEEMAVAFFAIAQPRTPSSSADRRPVLVDTEPDPIDDEVHRFVDDFFSKFDKNRDDKILRDELPLALKTFGFWRINQNGDEFLTRNEVFASATWVMQRDRSR